jgi:ATP-dependent helicase/nuclease subunit B
VSSALTQPELFALLDGGQTVLLPHAYAAQTMRARYQEHLAGRADVAEPGPVLSWQEWTRQLWSSLILEGRETRLLLNHLQEERLWADVISAQTRPQGFLEETNDGLAVLARSGLRLAGAYNTVEYLRSAADSFDTHTFAAWLDTFRDHCKRQALLSQSLLDDALTRHVRSGSLRLSVPVHMVGFDEETPAPHDLITALQRTGAALHRHSMVHEGAGRLVSTVSAPHPNEELRMAVRLVLQQAQQPSGATSTFALILPRPEEQRGALERLFREILAPELGAITADLSSTPWHFAAQPPLSSSALVGHALELLRWSLEPVALSRIGSILLSPYLTFAEPLETRARFEAQTLRDRRFLSAQLSLPDFLQFAAKPARATARFPDLRVLQHAIANDGILQGKRSHADWADVVRTILRKAGWPGPRVLSAAEFAATEAWDGLLDLISTLTATARRVSFAEFLPLLEAQARQATLPSPQGTAPVQVLTLQQAEGIPFDSALILDATDTNLPLQERLHPLLPRHMQTELRMPGADQRLSYARTRDRLRSLAARSGGLYLFAPEADETGALRITPLANEIGATPACAEDAPHEPAAAVPVELETVPDTAPLPELPSRHVSGGARVLELQAACGFRAFATFRLSADEISTAALGLDRREAGSVLHRALELLWRELKDQATLRALTSAARHSAVQAAVREALEPLHSSPASGDAWSRAFLHVLQRRLVRLLERWLELELERGPFTTLDKEQERVVQIGPLELSVRPDRIDQVTEGQVFVDYKTKYALSAQDWLGSRPDAPQLPLYALLADRDQLRGIAFARVRWDDQMGWVTLTDREGIFPARKGSTQHDLTAELDNWRAELTQLAEAFANGRTDISPKTYPETCQYCAHRLLCRLDPAELLAEAAEEMDEDELNA